jgi:DNA modification methylase
MFNDIFQFKPDNTIDIQIGDNRVLLDQLPADHFHTCITSPPYYGLRDYGHADQIGQENTLDEYIRNLVTVFDKVRRTLRDDGTLWLNLGDCYTSSVKSVLGTSGLKSKDLIGIPWRVAFALQADGWYLRQDIIWSKGNPMPESVRDRCTKSHEYIFLFAKSERYYFDHIAIKEPASGRAMGNRSHKYNSAYEMSESEEHRTAAGLLAATEIKWETRNKRSVWTVSSKPYAGAHFATFPPDLIRPCVLSGTPIDGYVLDPFAGSGTTGMVARQTGRYATLLELNPQYAAIARTRCDLTNPSR